MHACGGAERIRESRGNKLWKDTHLRTDAGYAPTAAAGCDYAQHDSRPRTPARRVDRDPCASPGKGRELRSRPGASPRKQNTIAPAHHCTKRCTGPGQLCEVWLRLLANIDANQRT